MCRQMDTRVTETFLPAHDEIVRAGCSRNKRLYRDAPHGDFGIADHDSGLESSSAINDVLRDDLQKHVSLFEHERFHIERSVSEQALSSLGDFGIIVGDVLG